MLFNRSIALVARDVPAARLLSTARRVAGHRESRLDSSFFHPSLSGAHQDGQTYKSRNQRTADGGRAGAVAILSAAAMLYLADSHFGMTRRLVDRCFGTDMASGFVHLDAATQDAVGLPSSSTQMSKSGAQVVVDPDTQQALPLYLPATASPLPSNGQLKLVGLGHRAVSFLRVRVYVAGLYMEESKIDAILGQGGLKAGQSLEELVKTLLDQGSVAVVRIVPVRNTDFNHLRDGFIRALQGRLKRAIKTGAVQSSSETERRFEESIQQIKDSFPRRSVPKGSALDMVVVPSGNSSSLSFEHDGEIFGQAKENNGTPSSGAKFCVARELVLAYFADKDEISPAFKKSVQDGFSTI